VTPKDLKNHREGLRLTQAEIAKLLGVSERFWHYRERGERPVPQWLALAIVGLLITIVVLPE
jgi:DNA-binding XRE family transcriptional regulator